MPIVEFIRKSGKQIRYRVEYLLVRGGLALLDAVPLRLALGLASVIGRLAFALDWRRRAVAVDNILRSGVAADRRAAVRLARRSFQHFAVMIAESVKSAPLFQAAGWREQVRFALTPELEALLRDQRQGVILATGHFGNWEISAQLIATLKPVAGVARPMSNPYVEEIFRRRRPRAQYRLIPKRDADVTRFLAALARGELLGLMIDQYGGRQGMMVNFFGRPAATHTAIALLHLVTKTPLCVGFCRRLGPLTYEMTAVGPLHFTRTGDKNRDVRAILEGLNAELEKVIRTAPEQYLWGHRRWRPPETAEASDAQ